MMNFFAIIDFLNENESHKSKKKAKKVVVNILQFIM